MPCVFLRVRGVLCVCCTCTVYVLCVPFVLCVLCLYCCSAHCLQDGRAAYLLSNVYEMGVGVERSRDRAVRFLTLAAKARYPPACTALAITLEEVRVQPISFRYQTCCDVAQCICLSYVVLFCVLSVCVLSVV